METTLTECVVRIMRDDKIEKPVIQILSFERQRKPNEKDDKCVAVLSDGVFFTDPPVWITFPADQLILKKELQRNSIVILENYECITTNTRLGKGKLMLVMKMSLIRNGAAVGKRIGDPVSAFKFSLEKRSPIEKSLLMTSKTPKTLPIAALNPNNEHWCIKARVLKKANIESSNDESFNVDLTDASGSITATASSTACRKFFNLLEVNKTFLISRFTIEHAQTESHKFTLILKEDSEVIPAIENIQFNFCDFQSIGSADLNASVDVLGICINTSKLQNPKNENQEGKSRCMRLMDDHKIPLTVVLRNELAEYFDISTTPIVALKEAQIKEDFGCRYVTVDQFSQVFVYPDIKEAREMKNWYNMRFRRRHKPLSTSPNPPLE